MRRGRGNRAPGIVYPRGSAIPTTSWALAIPFRGKAPNPSEVTDFPEGGELRGQAAAGSVAPAECRWPLAAEEGADVPDHTVLP